MSDGHYCSHPEIHKWRMNFVGTRAMSTAEKFAVHESQNWRCCYCGVRTRTFQEGATYSSLDLATIEHIIPVSEGGTNHCDNLVSACMWCNCARQNHSADEWFEKVFWMKIDGLHPHFSPA